MKGLTTRDLNGYLQGNSVTKKFFHGVYPAFVVPITNKKKYSFISNTHSHDKRGEHWCAWMVDGESITFFDSFGRHPTDPTFPTYYKDIIMGFKLQYNARQVQDVSSSTCGHYCIQFLYVLSFGLDLDFMLHDYGIDFKENDIVVLDFVNNL